MLIQKFKENERLQSTADSLNDVICLSTLNEEEQATLRSFTSCQLLIRREKKDSNDNNKSR